MKKRIIIILSIFILCLVCFLAFWWLQPKLISGNKSDLQQIIIIEDPNFSGQSFATVVTDKDNLDELFDAIKNTWTLANRRPSHNDSLQFDSDYKLIFIFSNVTEEIYIHADTAYCFLETNGGSGDPGYTRGNAKMIIEIIKKNTEDMTSYQLPQPKSEAVVLPLRNGVTLSELPVITLKENLLTYEKDVWPDFYPTPDSEPMKHPFDGQAAYNAFYADLNCDGVYEAYATISFGFGVITSYLLGYDPVTQNTYVLNERMIVEYDFVTYNGELFVRAIPSFYTFAPSAEDDEGIASEPKPQPPAGNPHGYYRPVLNEDTGAFDLEEIEEDLSDKISSAQQ